MQRISLIIALTALTCGGFALFRSGSSPAKTAYVQNGRLFNEFKGTLEAKGSFEAARNRMQASVDSMSAVLKALERQLPSRGKTDPALSLEFNRKADLHTQITRAYDRQMAEQEEAFTQQIRTQLNSYLKEFGELEGYDYIFGADGAGNLMYARESRDITTEVLKFVNQRYEGI